jgi:hypothetical protein
VPIEEVDQSGEELGVLIDVEGGLQIHYCVAGN